MNRRRCPQFEQNAPLIFGQTSIPKLSFNHSLLKREEALHSLSSIKIIILKSFMTILNINPFAPRTFISHFRASIDHCFAIASAIPE
jgi:hypothetical protein